MAKSTTGIEIETFAVTAAQRLRQRTVAICCRISVSGSYIQTEPIYPVNYSAAGSAAGKAPSPIQVVPLASPWMLDTLLTMPLPLEAQNGMTVYIIDAIEIVLLLAVEAALVINYRKKNKQ